jgi:hypothetical protein
VASTPRDFMATATSCPEALTIAVSVHARRLVQAMRVDAPSPARWLMRDVGMTLVSDTRSSSVESSCRSGDVILVAGRAKSAPATSGRLGSSAPEVLRRRPLPADLKQAVVNLERDHLVGLALRGRRT